MCSPQHVRLRVLGEQSVSVSNHSLCSRERREKNKEKCWIASTYLFNCTPAGSLNIFQWDYRLVLDIIILHAVYRETVLIPIKTSRTELETFFGQN